MADRIIYSTLCQLEHGTAAELDPYLKMARLWADHLRGPGDFKGRLILMSNLPDQHLPGVEWVHAPIRAGDRAQFFLERVRQFRHLPVRDGDEVMQLDLDALAIAPIERLFSHLRPGVLLAATSGLSPLHPDHAASLLLRRERLKCKAMGWSYRAGVSACVTLCAGADWADFMRRWAAAIRSRGRGRRVPLLGDQSFLNFLFVSRAAPIQRLPRHLICHLRQPHMPLDSVQARRATVLHFPLRNRLQEMERWSRLGVSTPCQSR